VPSANGAARRFRGDRPRLLLTGRTVVVVDDGIATGSTARAACQVARAEGAARVVLAVPVAPPVWTARLRGDADEFVCLDAPRRFNAVGQFYTDFSQTSDDDVVACLERAGRRPTSAHTSASADPATDPPSRDEEADMRAGPVHLAGHSPSPKTPAASSCSPTAAAAAGTAPAIVSSPLS